MLGFIAMLTYLLQAASPKLRMIGFETVFPRCDAPQSIVLRRGAWRGVARRGVARRGAARGGGAGRCGGVVRGVVGWGAALVKPFPGSLQPVEQETRLQEVI